MNSTQLGSSLCIHTHRHTHTQTHAQTHTQTRTAADTRRIIDVAWPEPAHTAAAAIQVLARALRRRVVHSNANKHNVNASINGSAGRSSASRSAPWCVSDLVAQGTPTIHTHTDNGRCPHMRDAAPSRGFSGACTTHVGTRSLHRTHLTQCSLNCPLSQPCIFIANPAGTPHAAASLPPPTTKYTRSPPPPDTALSKGTRPSRSCLCSSCSSSLPRSSLPSPPPPAGSPASRCRLVPASRWSPCSPIVSDVAAGALSRRTGWK